MLKEKNCPVCRNRIQFDNDPVLGDEVKCSKCGGVLIAIKCGGVRNRSTRLIQKKADGEKGYRKKDYNTKTEKRCPVCGKKITFAASPSPGDEVVCQDGCGAALVAIKCGGDYFPNTTRLIKKKDPGIKVTESKITTDWMEHRLLHLKGTKKEHRC
jgi:hypothetical protein